MTDLLDRYIELIRLFLTREISVAEFEGQFLDLWRSDRDSPRSPLSPEIANVIDRLMVAVDAVRLPPDRPGPYEIDEQQLRDEAGAALRRMGYQGDHK
jgi:hypothetical protein